MKLSIMQPYFFPYIGYFQLLSFSDKFIIYDDVSYIKQGWINRNKILVNNKPSLFTIPLSDSSSNKLICEVYVGPKMFSKWKDKFLRTINQAYAKAPYVNLVTAIVEDVLLDAADRPISEVATKSITCVASFLGINTPIVETSSVYDNKALSAQSRVLDICRQERADLYLNPIGGQTLYSKNDFASQGIRLVFIEPDFIEYKQLKAPFVPWLSILDVIMFNPPHEVRGSLLTKFKLS